MPAPVTILFVCTGNSCRSQMAEAMLRQLGGARFHALSAGTFPAGFVHPLALDALVGLGVPIGEQYSKGLAETTGQPVDAVITLCEHAAEEPCPEWPGNPVFSQWFLPDPVFHPGSDRDALDFATVVARRLQQKIQGLVELDWSADRAEIQRRLDVLGEI